MGTKFSTKYGDIIINEELVAEVSGIIATECYGIVGMAARSMKDDIVRLLKRENITKGIKVKLEDEDSVSIEFHIIVEYGTKISAVTENLASTVKYKVKDMLSLNVKHIGVFVEGVRVSK